MLDTLFNPDGFFRERADDPRLLPPVAIMVVIGVIGAVGGVAGVLLSVVAGAAIAQLALGDPLAALQPGNLVYYLAAFAFGVLTSVVSGLYPAWKAARERPVDALRG